MADVLFVGGPCAQQHGSTDPEAAGTGTILCGGINYHLYLLTTGNYLALLPGANPPGSVQPTEKVGPSVPDDANAAWHAFARTVGQAVPAHVNKTAGLRRQIRRLGQS